MKKDKNGYIKLNRSILDWQHYSESNYLIVFITLLLVANHSPRWWKGKRISRGQTMISVNSLSDICGLSKPTIVKVLKGLERSGEITRTKLQRLNSLTTILNYDKYQAVTPSIIQSSLPESLPEQEEYSNNIYNNNNKGFHEKILKDMLNGGILIERFCKAEGITKTQFEKLAHEVINEWELTNETHYNERDARHHLIYKIKSFISNRNIVSDNRDKRLAPFIASCKNLISQGYPIDKVREFYSYWTQPVNDKSGRLLFESIKAFDAEVRFKKNFNRKP